MLKFILLFYKLFKKIKIKYKIYYLFYSIISIAINFSFFYLIILYGNIVNYITKTNSINNPDFNNIKLLVLLYIGITIISYTFIKFFSILNIKFSENIKIFLQKNLFKAIISKSKLFNSNENNSGYYVQIFTKDLEFVSQLFLDFLFTLPSEFLIIIYILFYIFKINYLIFTISIILILTGILIVKSREKVISYYNLFDEEYKNFYSNYNKNIKGLETLKIYGKIEYLEKISLNHLKSVLKKYKIYIKHNFIYDFLIKFINEIYYITIFTICFFLLFKKSIIPGTYVLIIAITGIIKQKIDYFVQNLNYLQNFIPYLKRIDELIFIDFNQNKEFSLNKNFIEFINNKNDALIFKTDNLSLYLKNRKVFSSLNFEIKEKDKVWIKGKSGAGKSTLIKLLFFYKHLSNLKDYKVDGKLKVYKNLKTGILFQEPYIFNRSIKELFKCINQNIKKTEIEKYLEMVKLNYWYKNLKNGFNTKIGQQSKFISSGEKKRLQLARLFYYNPDILILDEPFVNLDKENIYIILNILKDLFNEKTIIINSHNNIVKPFVNKIIYVN